MDPTLFVLAKGLPRAALDGLAEALGKFPTDRALRGRELAVPANISAVGADSRGVRANVTDDHHYVSRWAWGDDGPANLCSCPAGRVCEHTYALGIMLLAAARRVGRWDHPRWAKLAPLELAAEPVGLHARETVPAAAHDELRHDHAVEALAHWADRGHAEPRRLRAVLTLEPGALGALLALEARVTGAGLDDAPRTWRQLEQLAAELKRQPMMFAPPEARLLRALTAPEFVAPHVPGGTRIEMSSERMQALLDRVPESPHFTWSPSLPPALAERAGVEPGARVNLQPEEVRVVPVCDTSGGAPRLELSFEWRDGATRPFTDAVLLSPLGLASGGRTHVALSGGRFVRIVDEPPREVVKLLQEGGLALRRNDGAVLEKLSRSFPVVRSALRRLTRVHDVDVVGCFELAADDWLRVRVFAASRAAKWQPGVITLDGAVFEYRPALGWMRVEPDDTVIPGLLAVEATDPVRAPAASDVRPEPAATAAPEQAHGAASEDEHEDAHEGAPEDDDALEPTEVTDGEQAFADSVVAAAERAARDHGEPAPGDGETPERAWFELPDPEHVAPVVEWIESLPQGDLSGKRKRGARVPLGAPSGWWLRLTPHVLESLADAWEARPHGVRWYADNGASGLFHARRAVPKVRVAASGMDWFTVSAEWQAEGLALKEQDLSLLRASRAPFVKLSSGWVRRADLEEFDEASKRLADLGLEAGAGEIRVPLWQLAQADPASLDALEVFGASAADLETVRALRERLAAFTGLPHVAQPAGVHAEMRPYQHDGLDFLAWTASIGLGSVLADDMGLGKTLQALAWLAHLCETDPEGGPSLVVCPASVMHHWAREAARFTPGLRVMVLESGRERAGHRARVAAHDLVITNYALLRHDIGFWRELPLRAVILDEAQQIKNPSAAVTRAALELRARHRVALTGTPLENRALDLWSIVSFVHPGFLGTRSSFSARYDQPDAPPHRRRLLSARLRPLLLRRLKQQVAQELPARVEERVDCAFTPGQRRLYLAELGRARAFLGTLLADPQGIEKNRMPVLATLTRLRQICCHPTLAGGRDGLGSGKFEALFDLLEPLLEEGHKVLLFSQFVECLKLIEVEFERRRVPYHMLTGQTTRRERVVSAFTEDPRPCVFLLSLRAGGLGLNLTAASYVILFDPWWNPAIEAQAIDRTHRIGQTRTVIAYRLLTEGTVEERIWELQQRKSALAKDLLGEESFARSLSRSDLEWLLSPPTEVEE